MCVSFLTVSEEQEEGLRQTLLSRRLLAWRARWLMLRVWTCRCDIHTVTLSPLQENCILQPCSQSHSTVHVCRHLSGLLDYCWRSQPPLSFFQFVHLVIWIAILHYYSQKLIAVCAVVWMHTCNAWQVVGRFFFFFGRLVLICCGIWTVCSVLCDCSGKLIAAESSIHKNECYLACLCKDLDASFEKVELTILGVYEWET